MIQRIEMTTDEQMIMYMNCSKKELCEMLIEANRHLKILPNNIILTYPEGFEKFIYNKRVIGRYKGRPLIIIHGKEEQYYEYLEGIKFENGYAWASHGGGCSGEDCNHTFIISPDNKCVAEFNW